MVWRWQVVLAGPDSRHCLIGRALGMVSGTWGVARPGIPGAVMDTLYTLPVLLLSVVPPSCWGAAFPSAAALCVVYIPPSISGLVRNQTAQVKAELYCGKRLNRLGRGRLWILRRYLLRKRDHLGARCCLTLKTLPTPYSCWAAWASWPGVPESIPEWGADLQQALTGAAHRHLRGRPLYPGLGDRLCWYWGFRSWGEGPGGLGERGGDGGKGGF